MKITLVRIVIMLGSLVFLVGCAPEKNIAMPEQFWQGKKDKIAVTETKTITPALYKTGNQGLLDYAINSAVTNSLDTRISRSDETWYKNLPHTFVQKLKNRNKTANEADMPISDNKKFYPSFATSVGANKLLVIHLEAFGAMRNYYSVIPMGAPKAYCQLSGELIDTATNQVIWRHRVTSTQEIQGSWDQPPLYPNVTNAIRVAANNSQEELLDSFFSGH